MERYRRDPPHDRYVTVYERSINVAREVFLPLSAHLLNPIDVQILKEQSIVGEHIFELGLPRVYLKCSQEENLGRVRHRSREAETDMG